MKQLAIGLALAALVAIAVIGGAQAKAKLEALPLGKKVPDFTLSDAEGKQHKLSTVLKSGKVVVLEWYNPDCPAVKKYREKSDFMNETWAKLDKKKVAWYSVNSGGPGKEGAGVKASKAGAKLHKIKTPILIDETGTVGKSYGAVCTPMMFVIDSKQMLVYRGAPDEAGALDKLPKGANYIVSAVEAALKGKKPAVAESKPFG
jgi:peroxiredoxin